MNEYFVSKELAIKLKEKGHMEKCFGYYLPSGNAELVYNYNQWRGAIFEDCLFSHNSLGEDIIGSDLIDAPTISQVLKWLREVKNIHIEVFLYDGTYSSLIKSITGREAEDLKEYHKCLNDSTTEEEFDTYEEAALAGIEYCLDNLI